jgi:hypothetical protein
MTLQIDRRAWPWLGTLLLALGAVDAGRADDSHLRDTSTPAATCLACHPFHEGHPVEVDYTQAVASRRHELRDSSDVVRRGVFLPGGRVVCHTCHDANSPWKSKIVIPPGSKVSGMVIPGNPGTYDPDRPATRIMTVEEARVVLPARYALSPKPLCLVCHALD